MLQTPLINVMRRAAEAAARHLYRDFGEVAALQVSRKGPSDFVSSADLRAEEILRDSLCQARPDYLFIGEEAEDQTHKKLDEGQRAWVVDPLDGTTNFLHGVPQFAISIACLEGAKILASLVYAPLSDEFFVAERGQGAFCNQMRLRVAGRSQAPDFLLATGFPFHGQEGHAQTLADLAKVIPEVAGLRRYGAAALDLAFVAAGRFDGFWQRGLRPWDFLGGALLVAEAGGFVSDLDGKPLGLASPSVVAGNEAVYAWLCQHLGEP